MTAFIILRVMVDVFKKDRNVSENGEVVDVLYIVRKICLIQDGIIILRCFQFELTNFWGRSMFLPKRKRANKNKFIM